MAAMKPKPITFRCTNRQLERLHLAMHNDAVGTSRTAYISDALQSFLDFVESKEGAGMNLFELVNKIDAVGSRVPFGEQA